MTSEKTYVNQSILERFDALILEGDRLWQEFKANDKGMIMDIIAFTRWSTSCLNLLDKLSITSNRFVNQFEVWVAGGPGKQMNVGAALGVLLSAKDEYSIGMAIDYHLSVSAAVFTGFLEEASYLSNKGFHRAAIVIAGAALEEGLKTRARSNSVEIGPKETLNPLIAKLKAPDVGVLTAFEAIDMERIAKMRNDDAHGGDFQYSKTDIKEVLDKIEHYLNKLLGHK